MPVRLARRSDVAVEKVDVPPSIRRGQPFDLRVLLTNDGGANAPTRGTLEIIRKAGEREEVVAAEPIEVPPGRHARTVRQQIDEVLAQLGGSGSPAVGQAHQKSEQA